MGGVPSIELIAIDLDGTLLSSDESVSPANRVALKRAMDAGIRIVLATGRGLSTPRAWALELGLNAPVICAHGALTVDPSDGTEVDHLPIPAEYANEILRDAQHHGHALAVYRDGIFYTRRGTPTFMADMVPPHWREVDDLLAPELSPASMLRALGEASVNAIYGAYAHLPIHFRLERWGDFVECAMTDQNATKHRALERLCAIYGISSERVMAIGDSPNDVPMMEFARIGVAMGNAPEAVRYAADAVTTSCNDDGVALAIDQFVFADQHRRSA